MASEESTPAVQTESSPSFNISPSSSSSGSSYSGTARTSDAHPWAAGKKVLKPVEVTEKERSIRSRTKSGFSDLSTTTASQDEQQPLSPRFVAYGCTADLIEANERLQEQLSRERAEKNEAAALLDGVRDSHAVVCAQLEATRNELANQEDELFVLREIHEEHVKEINELRKAKEFAEVERSMTIEANRELSRRAEATEVNLHSEIEALRQQLKQLMTELEEAKFIQSEQQEACHELLEEQHTLELAYEEAVARLEASKGHVTTPGEPADVTAPQCSPSRVPLPIDDDDDEGDVSQDWEKVNSEDFPIVPVTKGKTLGRKGTTSKFLSKRRRTPSQPLLSQAASPNDVQLVKNDVQQLKQTIALLVSERRVASTDGLRPSITLSRASSD